MGMEHIQEEIKETPQSSPSVKKIDLRHSIKKILNKSKSYGKIIFVSLLTTVAVFLVGIFYVYAHKDQIVATFAEEITQILSEKGLLAGAFLATDTVIDADIKEIDSIPLQDLSVEQVVNKTNNAVVSIIISKTVSPQIYIDPFDPFRQFFGGQIPTPEQNTTVPQKKVVGGGSGFFITQDGYIVTNRHVVSDPDAEYTVAMKDGKKYPAKIIAKDQVLDVAIIKVSGKNFPYLTLGNSDSLKLGQSVVAIGNALAEFDNSISVGVVSGLSRSVVAGDSFSGQSEQLDKVIQTDAAINPGNSGGPLIDLKGTVVGVNVAVAQGSQSIGFALPIDSIKTVIDSVLKTGSIVRPYIGIRYTQVTETLAKKNNLSVDYGIIISKGLTLEDLAVIPGSPADKAGLVENDIILEIDGQKITEDTGFSYIIRQKKVGDVVVLKVLSKGTTKTIRLTLAQAPRS